MGLTSIGLLLVATLAVLPILLLQGRRDEERVAKRWCFLMSPTAREEFDRTRNDLIRRLRCADASYAAALAMTGAARRTMLDLGLEALVETSPRLLSLVDTMLEFARQLAAIAPAPPISVRRFKGKDVQTLAAIQAVVHYFLVTTRERYAFRLYFISRAIRTLVTYMRTGSAREGLMLSRTRNAWSDYHVLNDETIESYRLLLISIAAVPAADRVERPASESPPSAGAAA